MWLKNLNLANFRNHGVRELIFDKKTLMIVGPNGSGKSNILEAIYLLTTGESFRGGKIEEMIGWNREVTHVMAVVTNSNGQTELQVTLTGGVVQGQKTQKRKFLVNGVGRSREKFCENLKAVIFRPEDMRLVEGNPARRRGFMDEVLTQLDREYRRSLLTYTNALRRRNKLLEMIREGKTNRGVLLFWDQLVLKHGEYLQKKRRELEDEFNKIGNSELKIANGNENFFESLRIVYKPSLMSPARLKQYEREEVLAGHMLVGPHRDDFTVIAKNSKLGNLDSSYGDRDLAVYGSRGEQRLGVLWLKIKSMEYVKQITGQRPLLLLDDIFSELDHGNRALVFSLLNQQQTIATTADEHYIKGIDALELRLSATSDSNK